MADIETFEPDGRAIAYADDHSTGPSLVLLAAEGLGIGYLGPLAEALAEEDFRVVRIGTRQPAGEDVTLHDLAQDVVDVMDHVGITRPWVGGHGFGGTLARVVAIDHPGRAAGTLLLGVEGPEPVSVQAWEHAETPVTARKAAIVAMQQAARAATADVAWSSLAPAVPVLVIQGSDDQITPASNGAALKDVAPDRVSVVTIDGGADLFPLSRVGETAWPIEDYLDWD